MEKELYLGENLNRAIEVRNGKRIAILDGREKKNPAAYAARAGEFVVTRRDGAAPCDVAYYGHPANQKLRACHEY